jgi:hypothetical protein
MTSGKKVWAVTREDAAAELAAAGIDPGQAAQMLDDAARFPGTWQYNDPARTRCVVKHMPSGQWEACDCAATEAAIRAASTRPRWFLRAEG